METSKLISLAGIFTTILLSSFLNSYNRSRKSIHLYCKLSQLAK